MITRRLSIDRALIQDEELFLVSCDGSSVAGFDAESDARELIALLQRATRVYGVHRLERAPSGVAPEAPEFGYGKLPLGRGDDLTVFVTIGGRIATFEKAADAQACIGALLRARIIWSFFGR